MPSLLPAPPSAACPGSALGSAPARSPGCPSGGIGNKAAAALVGVAPYDDDSGEHHGERSIKGGRREIRDLLFMATLAAATRHNPVIKAYYQRLRARGKKAKVALVACMGKPIVILNTMLARGQMWNPPVAPTVA